MPLAGPEKLGVVRADVIVYLERGEQVQHDHYTAPVERRAHVVLDEVWVDGGSSLASLACCVTFVW
jgi:hypothetical protein